jgi:putative DNA primase/helicase
MDLRAIACRLGGTVAGSDTVLIPGPGHGPRDRSLAVRLVASAPDGFVTHSHCGDDWKQCRDHVRALLGLPQWQPGDGERRTIPQQHVTKWDLATIEAQAAEDDLILTAEQVTKIGRARELWDEGCDPRGTLAEKYLREQRGLDLPDDLAGRVLRFHPHMPWRNEDTGAINRVPALIVPFRAIRGDQIMAVQRVSLREDGTKIGRRMMGVVYRATIKLDAAEDALTVGEGLETVMAGRQLGFSPAWCLGSVGLIAQLPLITDVKTLTILGEAGAPSAKAIEICGARWRKAGRRVLAAMPSVGSDMNDVLLAERGTS